jgi:hypothetical protein
MADYWGVDENDDSEEAWLIRDINFGKHIQPLVDAFGEAVERMARAVEQEEREELAQLVEIRSLPTIPQHARHRPPPR